MSKRTYALVQSCVNAAAGRNALPLGEMPRRFFL